MNIFSAHLRCQHLLEIVTGGLEVVSKTDICQGVLTGAEQAGTLMMSFAAGHSLQRHPFGLKTVVVIKLVQHKIAGRIESMRVNGDGLNTYFIQIENLTLHASNILPAPRQQLTSVWPLYLILPLHRTNLVGLI